MHLNALRLQGSPHHEGTASTLAALVTVTIVIGLPARARSRTLSLPSPKSLFHFRIAESLRA